jgi:selenocysteine-specific elongation factor
MILGVCGHVDHGKTTLVRALTGVDTDRLPEEQRRGMTIEPGHAHMALRNGKVLSLVDAPGHSGFLRQAIAGLSAADAALLVVACDDGPMPQTREHLDLLGLLGIRRGLVVLTKADRVSPGRVARVREEVLGLMQGTPLADLPCLAVSAVADGDLAGLREALDTLASQHFARETGAAFRLPVDRSFSRTGAGTVVTGTVLSGSVRQGETLCVSPSGASVRVRGVQRHGAATEQAFAGERCALALAGIERSAVQRGDAIMAPQLHAPGHRWDVSLQWLASAPRSLPGHAQLYLHLASAALPVRVVLLTPRVLAPGESGLAQLLLSAPLTALHGDRFVLRDTAANATVGGGRVIDAQAPARGRATPARLAELRALEGDDPRQVLAQLLALRPAGIDLEGFARQRNLAGDHVATIVSELPCRPLATGSGFRCIADIHWETMAQRLREALAAWHTDHPFRVGMPEHELLGRMRVAGCDPAAAAMTRAVLRDAIGHGEVVRDGLLLRHPEHVARLDGRDAGLLANVRALLQTAGPRPPAVGEIAPVLGLPLEEVRTALARMAALGHLVQVARNRFFLPESLPRLLEMARSVARESTDGRFDAASFRDRSALGRNLSIQVLEFFDRAGHTRYRAQHRVLAESFRGPAPAPATTSASNTA